MAALLVFLQVICMLSLPMPSLRGLPWLLLVVAVPIAYKNIAAIIDSQSVVPLRRIRDIFVYLIYSFIWPPYHPPNPPRFFVCLLADKNVSLE